MSDEQSRETVGLAYQLVHGTSQHVLRDNDWPVGVLDQCFPHLRHATYPEIEKIEPESDCQPGHVVYCNEGGSM